MNSMRSLMIVGALTAGTLGLAVSPASASSHTSTAPGGVGKTVYETGHNDYWIHDTKADNRAVGVIFFRPNGAVVGFQSCHNGAHEKCRGDLPGWVNGKLCMKTERPAGERAGASGPPLGKFRQAESVLH